jgi:predicted O-linked N-acetylglucosamine transferase (SPINDLY family)
MLRRFLAQVFRPRRAALEPGLEKATALRKAGRLDEAERTLRAMLAAAPDAARLHVHLGIVLAELDRLAEAGAHLERAVVLEPHDPYSLVNLGNVWRSAGDGSRALGHYRAAVSLQPGMPLAWSNMLRPLLDACDWESAERGLQVILQLREQGDRSWARYLAPMDALLLPLPPGTCREVADYHAAALQGPRTRRAPPPAPRPGSRLRVAYLSRDFRDHAVGQLARSLLRHHDRGQFEVVAYSYGRDDGSRCRREIESGADRFVDVRSEPAARTAARIAGDGVDLLVDLGGYTTGHRLAILAARPAPLQAHYLGYPGTLGEGLADYYLTDVVASPSGQEAQFAEQLVRLPGCFMVSDPDQPLAGPAPSREELGLPRGSTVLCAFHQTAKITREVFDTWCAILRGAAGSVLWLKAPGTEAEERLARRASGQGVSPERLLYAADLADKRAHVTRMAAADLFLDTFGRYNGHSTVNDALWAGLPVVTVAGEMFAARVAASLVSAAGVPELAAADTREYVRRAVQLACDACARDALRNRLAAARARAPLFDIAGTVRAIEGGYRAMWRQHCSGVPPRPIRI